MLLLTLAAYAAAMIPPPPGWTPPRASGPGTFCGRTFTLQLLPTETLAMDWPGEMFINDNFGTYRVAARMGNVVVTEVGARTRQRGRSQAVRGSGFRQYGPITYSLAVPRGGTVKALEVLFPDRTLPGDAAEVLRRIRLGGPTGGAQCLQPQNR